MAYGVIADFSRARKEIQGGAGPGIALPVSRPILMNSYYTFLLFATSKVASMGIKEKLYFLFWGGVQNIVSPKASVSRMSLHGHGEYISDQIRRTKRHYELANLVKVSLLSKVSYFVDVGANIGNHGHFFGFKGGRGRRSSHQGQTSSY